MPITIPESYAVYCLDSWAGLLCPTEALCATVAKKISEFTAGFNIFPFSPPARPSVRWSPLEQALSLSALFKGVLHTPLLLVNISSCLQISAEHYIRKTSWLLTQLGSCVNCISWYIFALLYLSVTGGYGQSATVTVCSYAVNHECLFFPFVVTNVHRKPILESLARRHVL